MVRGQGRWVTSGVRMSVGLGCPCRGGCRLTSSVTCVVVLRGGGIQLCTRGGSGGNVSLVSSYN